MSEEGEWEKAGTRRIYGDRTHKTNRFNNLHSQKRVSILKQVSNGSIDPSKAEQLLRSVNFRSIPRNIYCRTTKSGAVAVYGFSTRPIVLYEDRWFKFLEWLKTDELTNYLSENSESLRKPHVYPERENTRESETMDKEEITDDTI